MIKAEDIRACVAEIPHKTLVDIMASLIYQLTKRGIAISGCDTPEYIDGFDENGEYFRVEARKDDIPLEEMVTLSFRKYDEMAKV